MAAAPPKKLTASQLLAKMSGKKKVEPGRDDVLLEIAAAKEKLALNFRLKTRPPEKEMNSSKGAVVQWEGKYKFTTGQKWEDPAPMVPGQKDVLKELFDVTGGFRWKDHRGWVGRRSTVSRPGLSHFGVPIQFWHGVETEETEVALAGDEEVQAFVRGLNMPNNDLDGHLPSRLCTLGSLVSLHLPGNQLTGPVPRELFSALFNLQHCDLSCNCLEGELPADLGQSLRTLALADNSFTGELPASIGACEQLNTLDLASNDLHGAVPEAVGALTKLRKLSLRHNGFTGELPQSLSQLTALKVLDIGDNMLSGDLQRWVLPMTGLRMLDFSNNAISGVVPPELSSLQSLTIFYGYSNRLIGHLPPEIGALAKLKLLNLSFNDLEGVVPQTLTQLASLELLLLHGNRFHCPMPPHLSVLGKVVDLAIIEPSYSQDLEPTRRFTQPDFQRVYVHGPRLGLNNTHSP